MRWLRRLLVFALFVAALVLGWRFAHSNEDPVFVDYLAGTIEAPRWAVLGSAFGLGALSAGLVGGWQTARLALLARRWRRTARALEREVHELRNLPLADAAGAGGARSGPRAAPNTGRSG
jgi:uncharacterized integral membrane protein